MARRMLLVLLLLTACHNDAPAPPPVASASSVPLVALVALPTTPMTDNVIRTAAEVPSHVGQTITLEGDVERTKLPTLLGVDVSETDSLGHDSRGKRCRVTGVLQKHVVTDKDLEGPITANRGPGTFYYLARADGQGLATPIPIAK